MHSIAPVRLERHFYRRPRKHDISANGARAVHRREMRPEIHVQMQQRRPMDSEERIKEHWRSQRFVDARSYTQIALPRWIAEGGQGLFRDNVIATLERRTRDQHPFRRVVDLGCGVGDWTMRYLDFAERVTGADINDSFIEKAREDAAREGLADRADFHVHDIAAWDDFEDADFVTIGAVLTCLSERENEALLGRVRDALARDDYLYVRATIVQPGREPFSTSGGNYRRQRYYDELFRRMGFEEVFSGYSHELLTSGALVRAGVPHRVAQLSTLGLNSALTGVRLVRRRADYFNWLLRRV
jgi:SAM-dependent methyltransferase